jgi:AhpD family alkylhydroperoxidase
MTTRIDVANHMKSGLYRAMAHLQNEVQRSGLDPSLLELVKIRASQINGCAYCIDMHTKDARAMGETEQRIYALNAWQETPFFSERERAALEWVESVTLVSEAHVPDEVYTHVRDHFDEAGLVALTFAVMAINSWNRLAIALRMPVGTYQPAAVGA